MKVQVFEWLKGDKIAYFEITSNLFTDTFSLKAKSWDVNIRENYWLRPKNYNPNAVLQIGYGGSIEALGIYGNRLNNNDAYLWNSYQVQYKNINEIKLWNDNGTPRCELNGIIYTSSSSFSETANFTQILQSKGNISYFKTDTLHLKPCKLLSPYGTHPAGECCMIDVLSNTLYFNQGSGAFSVEGEAGEIIDTTPVVNNIISPQSKVAVRLREWMNIKVFNSPSSNSILEIDNVNSISFKFEIGKFGTWLNTRIAEIGNKAIDCYDNGIYIYQAGSQSMYLTDISNHDFFLDKSGIVIDGVKFDLVSDNINFKIRASEGSSCNMRIYDVDLGTIHLHPAELAIPYENHPIGECCMIDLNSGDLYFNEGTGSFSCEGAFLGYWQDKPMVEHYCDVEGTLHRSVQIFADNGERLKLIWEKNLPFTTHRWLKCDGYIAKFNLPLTSLDVTMRNLNLKGMVWKLYFNNNKFCDLWMNGVSANYNFFSMNLFYNNVGEIAHFRIDGKTFWVNDKSQIVNDGYIDNATPSRLYGPNTNPDWKDGVVLIGNVSNRYVPAILDRPTLPTEDNNNIARKQGEAVFVDEERYRQGLPWCFGNVASSGSFSVSDYLIEGEDYERISGVRGDGLAYIQVNGLYDIRYDSVKFICERYADVIGNNEEFLLSQEPYNEQGTTQALRVYVNLRNDGIASMSSWLSNSSLNYKVGLSDINSSVSLSFKVHNEYIEVYDDYRYISVLTYALDGVTQKRNHINWAYVMDNYPVQKMQLKNLYISTINGLSIQNIVVERKIGNINLIPVRLLRTIEPTCTHNGKGGKVGEIGFFDTISGKFYGNDGQGEFTEYVP